MGTVKGFDHTSLPIIDRLIDAGQPVFGVFAQVKSINYLDYHSYLISQKPLPTWRKALKANQFCFIQITASPWRICLALATIKLASSAFVYVYNADTQQLAVCEALQPLTRHAGFDGDHYQGEMCFTHADLALRLNFSPAQVSVDLDGTIIALKAVMERHAQPLAICTPTGRRGWTFTQKEPFRHVKGQLIVKPTSALNTDTTDQVVAFSARAVANLDWTLGFMRHKTNWFWTCINHTLADGRHFLLNLSMGVNETGHSENACWLDGVISYLPPVMFTRHTTTRTQAHDSHEEQGLWRIYHQNLGWSVVDIDLTFTPMHVYKKSDHLGVVASIFEQWLGLYSGTITLPDEVIELDNVMGLAEDHFAKW